jgi:endoglucanase
VASRHLSFNLINEPNGCTLAQYARVMRHAAAAVREADPDRLLVADGMFGEVMLPVPALADLPNAVHGTRGYAPFSLTHYLAPWAGTPREMPRWPTRVGGMDIWDRDRIDEICVLAVQGMQYRAPGSRILVGEWGCWNRTPHAVTMAWMRDCLALWKRAGWGWALWCFRGSFGVLDSQRGDVSYENWHGHKLDRRMLELLRES